MAKITKVEKQQGRTEIQAKTRAKDTPTARGMHWWKAKSKKDLQEAVLDTVAFLKEQQQYRWRQAALHARMYGNMPLMNFGGSGAFKANTQNSLPVDRPTMNVVQSCIDTLTARLGQVDPRPMFLTDNGNHKKRKLGKQMNVFINGELYQTDAHELGRTLLRDSGVLGTGCAKVVEDGNKRVAVERTLLTQLLVDHNDAFYGKPRSMYEYKLVDREVVMAMFPDEQSKAANSEQAYTEATDHQKTMSDQIMLAEAWHLPSKEDAGDGRHVIVCSAGVLLDEEWTKDDFPFVFLPYAPRLVGFWAQGLAEQLTGTQVEINKLLVTISKSINLVGVPRVFVEDGSKVVKAHLNNEIGSIVTYRGTKPEYAVAPSVHPELYQQLQRLVDYAYQQSGISALAAASQKPAGLNSGEALRNYDELQSERFSTLEKRYKDFFTELTYKIIDKAAEICERDGKYQTIYPNKDGTREIDLVEIQELLKDPFVIQCYETSSLPKEPAGRLQKVTEMMQAGIIDIKEGRRLLDFPDIEQSDKLATAAQERIYKILDEMVEDGTYTPPDPWIDLAFAMQAVGQYYNLYAAANLPESRLQMLRDWQSQVIMLQTAAQPPQPEMPVAAPTAVAEAPPTNPMIPNAPTGV